MFCVYISMCRDVKIQSTNSKIVYGHYVNRNLPSEKKRSFSILFFLSVFALVFVWLTNLFHRCLNRLTAPKRWNMVFDVELLSSSSYPHLSREHSGMAASEAPGIIFTESAPAELFSQLNTKTSAFRSSLSPGLLQKPLSYHEEQVPKTRF